VDRARFELATIPLCGSLHQNTLVDEVLE